jgi:hypothetical protein
MGGGKNSLGCPAGGDDTASLRAELRALRDALFDVAVLNNPSLFAPGNGATVVQPKEFAPAAVATDPTAAQVLFKNNSDTPRVVAIQAITDDNSDFTLLYGCGRPDQLRPGRAAGCQFGRVLNIAVVVQPNSTLQAAVITQTGNVLVTTTPVPLKGAIAFMGICTDDEDA